MTSEVYDDPNGPRHAEEQLADLGIEVAGPEASPDLLPAALLLAVVAENALDQSLIDEAQIGPVSTAIDVVRNAVRLRRKAIVAGARS